MHPGTLLWKTDCSQRFYYVFPKQQKYEIAQILNDEAFSKDKYGRYLQNMI